MRVGVEEAVHEDHLHPGLGDAVGQAPPVLDRPGREIDPPEHRSLDALHREHARGGVAPVDLGDRHAVVAGEVAPEDLGVAGLDAVVELAPDRARELVDRPHEVDELELPDPLPGDPGDLVQQLDVGVDLALGVGPLDLDDHLLAAGQAGPVDLADRRGRDRLLLEVLEDLLDREVELLLHHLADAGRTARGARRPGGRAARSRMSGGTMSGRVASSWPNLTKVGPSSSSISRSRRPRLRVLMVGRRRRPPCGRRRSRSRGGRRPARSRRGALGSAAVLPAPCGPR